MAEAPQFTKDELCEIIDALSTHYDHVARLYHRPSGEHRSRLKGLIELKAKAIAIMEATGT